MPEKHIPCGMKPVVEICEIVWDGDGATAFASTLRGVLRVTSPHIERRNVS
jgi:hypothetical protein